MKKAISFLVTIIMVAAVILAVTIIIFNKGTHFKNSTSGSTPNTTHKSDIQPNDTETDNKKSDTDPAQTMPIREIDAEVTNSLTADQIFVYDISAGEYIFKKNTDTNITPAAVTQLFVALYSLDNVDEDTVIQPGDELSLVKSGTSTAYIKTSHKLTVKTLIKGMLMPSGCDAAYALAAGVARQLAGNNSLSGNDAVKYFMNKLNEYAVKIGCTGTHFSVPDGDASTDQYTTADDLVIIAKRVLQNETISKIVSTPSEKVTYSSGETNIWKNTNLLINPDSSSYSKYVTGMKTGTMSGKSSVLVSADIDGHEYIIGVFGAPNSSSRYSDVLSIIDALAS